MNELLILNQEISIVPKDFRNSNKGKVLQLLDNSFTIDLEKTPTGLDSKMVAEFYSETKNGTLYFTSPIVKTDGNIVLILNPKKHRFLQRRAFSRIKFIQEIELNSDNKIYKATIKDLAAGGVKLKTNELLNLDSLYTSSIKLPGGEILNLQIEPIKIEKSDEGSYTLAGRFTNLSKKDKIKIIQFCMRKSIEYNKGKNE